MGFFADICKREGITLTRTETFEQPGLDSIRTSLTRKGFNPADHDGFYLKIGRSETIAYNHRMGLRAKQYTVAHELGHALLGHSDSKLTAEQQEAEANIFASVMLAMMLIQQESEEREKVEE